MKSSPVPAPRRGPIRGGTAALLLAVCAMPAVAQPRADPRWQVGVVPSLLSGTYGSETKTDIWYTPVIVRRLFDAGDLTAVLPHMCLRGGDDVTVVGGMPVRTSSAGETSGNRPANAAATPPSRTERPAAGSSDVPGTAAPRSACGFGDIIIRGRYYLLDERAWWPTIAVRAHVKVPTADEAKGLGTGRADEGIDLEVSRSVGRGVIVMVDGGYTKIGQPADRRFRDRWWYDVGVSRPVVADRLDVSVFFEHYRSIVDGRPDARDVVGVLTLRGTAGWRLQMSGQMGLSDGAPDVGLTIGATSRF